MLTFTIIASALALGYALGKASSINGQYGTFQLDDDAIFEALLKDYHSDPVTRKCDVVIPEDSSLLAE